VREHGRDQRLRRRITLRFFREFLTQCSQQLEGGGPLAQANLAAATHLLPELGSVDRAAFALTRWAWTRSDRAARAVRWWLIEGLERSF
jgi:hypothetical protein